MDNLKDDRYYLAKLQEDMSFIQKYMKDVPWTDIYGLRNRIVHEYGHIDLQIVYDTLVYDIPELAEKLV
ncbi:MAG: HepT-like ribonuclease domain-containing protein [Faecalimonas sp.]|nr:HepT-like ribonuclease domain-containing protein [Faecalimonas sp.]